MPNAVSNTSYNDANQMLSFNDKNISYDNNGNITSVTNSCGTTNYTWDVRSRLSGISGFTVNCSPFTANFKYDALGRRIEKTINGTTTQYLYDGVDVIQEKNQSGAVTANYIRTLNIDEPLTRIKGSTVRHYLKDALGSVIALTDDSGAVKTTYSYDPFGNTTVSGEPSDNPFQYTGRENDQPALSGVEGGLYYYRARYYSPELQRFISEDPLQCERNHGKNLFVYAKNNPVKFTDPSGLTPACKADCYLMFDAQIAFGCYMASKECGDECDKKYLIKIPPDPIGWGECIKKCGAKLEECVKLVNGLLDKCLKKCDDEDKKCDN